MSLVVAHWTLNYAAIACDGMSVVLDGDGAVTKTLGTDVTKFWELTPGIVFASVGGTSFTGAILQALRSIVPGAGEHTFAVLTQAMPMLARNLAATHGGRYRQTMFLLGYDHEEQQMRCFGWDSGTENFRTMELRRWCVAGWEKSKDLAGVLCGELFCDGDTPEREALSLLEGVVREAANAEPSHVGGSVKSFLWRKQ